MDEFIERLRDLGSRLGRRIGDLGDDLVARVRDALDGRRRAPAEDDDWPDEPPTITPGSRRFSANATVVTVAPQDDVPAVIGRIEVAASSEVVLVVPRRVQALRRVNAWPHIAAYARRNGLLLGVIAPRREVRLHARAHGLTAATSVAGLRHAREPRWVGSRGRLAPSPRGMWVRLGVFAVAIAAVVFVACYRVPSATVVLVPPSETYTLTAEAQTNAVIDRSDPARGILSASTIRREVTTVVSTTTSGTTEVGDASATLQLRITNGGTQAVTIPAGLLVATGDDDEAVAFETDEEAIVEPDESVTVPATAVEPGTDGNVPIGAVTVTLGDVPADVTVANSTAGSGGTDQTVPAVAAADVDRVREIAPGILQRLALSSLRNEVNGGRLIESTITAAVFTATPVQQLDEPADVFIMEYVVIAAALWIPDAEAAAYGAELIRLEIPEGTELLPGTVSTVITEAPGGLGVVVVEVTGLVTTFSAGALAEEITGMAPDAAAELIQELTGVVEPPRISIAPGLVPWLWLPRRANAIEVRLAGPGALETP